MKDKPFSPKKIKQKMYSYNSSFLLLKVPENKKTTKERNFLCG